MPTWVNHFRVADKLIDKLSGIDKEYFVIGTIAPDCGKFSKVHGCYKPYTGVTHFTKEISYSKKTDCNYNHVYETYVKNEIDAKKRSFFLAYYIHLFEDCIFAKNIFMPIETKYGNFRENEDVRRQVAKGKNNIDFMFLANNVSPSFEIFKKCKPFKEKYPEWYKHNEITHQMKNIVEFYSNPTYEDIEYKFLSPKVIDDFVEVMFQLLCSDMKEKEIL